jgi:processive 1,2-diacylglycerol beta-glucosyltransferase
MYSDRNPVRVSKLVDLLFGRLALAWISRQNPDLIISTFSVAGYVAKERLKSLSVPVVSVITDAGRVNRIWFHGDIDFFFLSDPDTADVGVAQGVARAKMLVTGPPISSRYANLPSKREARTTLGLEDSFTVLITGGGLGLGRQTLEVARGIVARNLPVQLIMAPGANRRLMKRFKSISRQRDLVADGFTSDFPVLMAASDIVVGKAGWLTLNEAAAAKAPTLVVDVLPGQEEENAIYAAQAGFARVISADTAADLIEQHLHSKSMWPRGLCFPVEQARGSATVTSDRIASEILRIIGGPNR